MLATIIIVLFSVLGTEVSRGVGRQYIMHGVGDEPHSHSMQRHVSSLTHAALVPI